MSSISPLHSHPLVDQDDQRIPPVITTPLNNSNGSINHNINGQLQQQQQQQTSSSPPTSTYLATALSSSSSSLPTPTTEEINTIMSSVVSLNNLLQCNEQYHEMYHAFKNHCKQQKDILFHLLISCYSAIRQYIKHVNAGDLNEALQSARFIFNTYLPRDSMPLDMATYTSLKFLSVQSPSTKKLESLLNDTSSGLFNSTGYDAGLGLFGSLKTSSGDIPAAADSQLDSSSSGSSNGSLGGINPATTTTNTETTQQATDINERITLGLFDKVDEYIITKLEPEYQKFSHQYHHAQLQKQQQLKQQQLQQQQQKLLSQSNDSPQRGARKVEFKILPGEVVGDDKYPVYYIDNLTGEFIPSILYPTNFRLIFVSKLTYTENFSIPLATIYRIDRVNHIKVEQLIGLWCKDFRKVEFFIIPRELYPSSDPNPQHDHTAPLIGALRQMAFPLEHTQLFAYKFNLVPDEAAGDGWRTYDLFSEFIRQDLNFKLWRTSDVNCEYEQPTYPARFVVPDCITDDELRVAAGFRSKGRLPTVCWVSREGVPLARSSQPMVGITRARCAEDEKLVEMIRTCCPSNRPLYLLDARPKANAIGNLAKGMGYEMSYNCNIEFLGIGNIHAMRDAVNKLEQLVYTSNTPPNIDDGWLGALEGTKWMDHIRAVLIGATRAAELINTGNPVLLHCSDGWDRTSQLSSLALLLLDPYYRTIKGFQVLIEKEWLSFGHMFNTRVRHGDRNYYTDSQRSPVFLQFIDCVYQVQCYYHDFFEFNEQYLIAILDALYSCQYGTFLCNSDKERVSIKTKTVSLWTQLNSPSIRQHFTNPFYNPNRPRVPSPMPVWRGEHVQLWRTYYYRYYRQPSKEPITFETIALSLKDENKELRAKLEELQQQIERMKLAPTAPMIEGSEAQNGSS
ncbi:hypothetical protein SAMD00019534_012210 [Acytostelium subglobosum LB1]|uniref:hypothetical protein n=1 Tax=Acytostelium subglobosum LB1 TaxID=1410327 RepID=UPI000644ED01|nr:hypothetical protein SAMD00019534_012210 [Acytostelium subglobosum LB1]GAM18046.1 hypothetical protein SAMD00019534_012210 [Acytostelium subglobosum LB1]|eukprot:XP_012758642.1 hypothetical protein SAMD00019534_012210 [Acytostelium subglobosum LB1]